MSIWIHPSSDVQVGYSISSSYFSTLTNQYSKDVSKLTKFSNVNKNGKWIFSLNKEHLQIDYGLGFDDRAIGSNGFMGPIDMPSQLNVFDKSYSSLYISTNGLISFSGVFDDSQPVEFPFNQLVLAPFWSSFDLAKGGSVFYRVINSSKSLIGLE